MQRTPSIQSTHTCRRVPQAAIAAAAVITLAAVNAVPVAHAATYSWSDLVNGTAVSANWSAGTNWTAAPGSAADTTLSFGMTYGVNSTAETNLLTNDVANPFLLNVLTFGGSNPTAGSGSNVATVNIAGSALNFVVNGATAPVVNLNANRSNGQGVVYNVQNNVTLSDNITFQGNGTATFNFSGIISGTNRTLVKNGTSTLTLSGANDFTGGVTLNAGTLAINSDASLGAVSNSITLGGNVGITSGAAANVDYTRALSLGANTLTLRNTTANVTATFSGAISGTGGITGASGGSNNVISLSNTNNTFTGNLTMQTGTGSNDFIRFASIGDGGSIVFGRSSWLAHAQYSGSANLTLNSRNISLATTFGGAGGLDGGGNPISMFANNGSGVATISTNMGMTSISSSGFFFFGGTNTGDNTFSGAIADPTGANTLGIGKWDAGKWILSNTANSYEGRTWIVNGTLSVPSIDVSANAQPLGKGSIIQFGQSSTSGTLEHYGSGNSSTDKQVQIGNATAGNTGAGSILNNGTGTLTFSNSTFNTTIAGITATRTLTLGGSNTGTNEVQGVIQNNNTAGSGLVALTKANTGVWRLSNTASTFTGATTINAGVLEVAKLADGGSNSSIGASAATNTNLNIGSGATLRYVGTGDTTNRAFRLTGSVAGNNAVIDASGSGPIVFSNTGAVTNQNNNISYFLQLTGTNTGDNTLAANMGNNGSGARSLTKNGVGKWVLTGDTSYTGATSVNAGTLSLGGAGDVNSSSGVTVAAGATFLQNSSVAMTVAPALSGTGTGAGQRAVLGGSGSINAAVALNNAGDTLSPGNSPGTLTFGVNQSWSAYSYDWELNDWTDTVAGTDFDRVSVTGTLDLTSASAASIVLNILSLKNDNTSGLVGADGGNVFAETDRSWTILSATTLTGFDANDWLINAAGFADAEGGTWSVTADSSNVYLNYTAIPEPTTLGLLAMGAVGLMRRRRVA